MRTFLLSLFTFFAISTMYAQYPTNGLVAQYGFDNGSLLVDGANGQDFTQTGPFLTEIIDRFGNPPTSAINLSISHLTRNDIIFPVDSEGFGSHETLSFWVRTTTTSSDVKVIIDDSNRANLTASNWAGNYIYLQNGKIGATFGVEYLNSVNPNLPFKYANLLTSKVISDGNWHHVAVQLSNTRIRTQNGTINDIYTTLTIFLDGVNSGSVVEHTGKVGAVFLDLAQSHDTNGNITVGNNRANSLSFSNRYTNDIDDILIYNRLLTTTEISDIANFNYCYVPNKIIDISNITEVDAYFKIPGSGIYDVAYVRQTEPFANAVIVSNVDASASAFQVTGLLPSTIYDVYHRVRCTTSTNASAWSLAQSFRTKGVIFVNANATGANDGSSWVNAYTNLQSALFYQPMEQEYWVAAGTYHPSIADRTASFVIREPYVKLYGGFSGTETQLSDRIIGANETILSGDLNNNDDNIISYVNTTRDDNSHVVLRVLSPRLLLDGLTITAGHANGATSNFKNGGGIHKAIHLMGIKIVHCKIQKNVAVGSGAGVYTPFNSTISSYLDIENCTFSENVSPVGSAVYSYVDGANSAVFNISNSLFEKNKTIDNGAELGTGGSSLWLRAYGNGSTFNGNIIGNTFVKNEDLGTLAGMNNFTRATLGISQGAATNRTMNVMVANNIFWGNTTTNNVIARSISGITEVQSPTITVKNSIDQNNFFNIPSSSKTATSNSNPLFNNLINGDYTLTSSSTAINTGDNATVIGTTDLVGNQRIHDTTVDMGAYEYASTVLGVQNSDSAKDFIIYPNPATSQVYVQSNEKIKSIEIYSLEGKLVHKSENKTMDVSGLPAGIYLVKVITFDNQIKAKKLIKK